MAVAFSTPAREVLEQINREPRFRRITTIPVFPVRTIALLVAAYTLFALSCAGFLTGQVPWLVMTLLNGLAVYAAFTPLHDATHRSVSSNRGLNDAIGTVACALLLPGITTRIYRYLHLEHHRFAGDATRDPDEPFVSATSLRLPLVIAFPDVLWSRWYLEHWSSRPAAERVEFCIGLAIYIGLHIGFLLSPWATEFALLWMLPQRMGLSLVTYFFARIQHPEGVVWADNPFQCTVRVLTNPMGHFAMLGQTLHNVHHLFPSVPFYRYHQAWAAGRDLLEPQNIPTRTLFRASNDLQLPAGQEAALLSAEVVSVNQVGDNIRAYELNSVDGSGLPAFEAGAHIDVDLGDGRRRQYSLCNPQTQPDRYVIAVKEETLGQGGSTYLHRSVTEGMQLKISTPRNHFPLRIEATDVVLVAGGIGLTPLLSMAAELHRRQCPFRLHIFTRGETAYPFANSPVMPLKELPFCDRIQIHVSDGDPEHRAAPMASAGDWKPGRQLYICGPTGFMLRYIDAIKDAGWPDAAIFSETFVPRQRHTDANRAFEVVLARSGRTLAIAPDEFLLDVLNRHNCGVICSCTQGICGSCITTVLAGEPEHRDAVLSDDERAANDKMCVCVSRARSEKLVLDL